VKENDARVIVVLPNRIQISKSLGFSLFDVLKKKMQEKLPAAVTINRRVHSKGFPLTKDNIF
jgi:hypothetical protein